MWLYFLLYEPHRHIVTLKVIHRCRIVGICAFLLQLLVIPGALWPHLLVIPSIMRNLQ